MKVALCMRGAISKKNSDFPLKDQLYSNESEYVDYVKCYNSIVKHIIEPNKDKYSIDIFCQSWNFDLKDEILDLYKPLSYLFEDNRIYNHDILQLAFEEKDFGGISQALSIKKSIELKEQYEIENSMVYDLVILYRYDIFLWKDILFDNYTDLDNKIYVNAHPNSNGDFHFVMNKTTSNEFKYLYDSIKLGNRYYLHRWIKNYVIHYMHKQLVMDDIIPGHHQEVIRKIVEFSINNGRLSIDLFNSY